MVNWEIKELQIGDLIAKIPIIQGGMGVGISLSSLASAVANHGGIGVISTAGIGMFEPDFETNYVEANVRALQKEIRKARELTDGILGVNIMVALSTFDEMVETSINEGIDIIFCGAGLPLNLPKYANGKTKFVPIVSSARAAKIILKKWIDKYEYIPDAIIIEGPLAGGHIGFKIEQIYDPEYSLEKLLPQVIKTVKPYIEKTGKNIPVIAAGGIYTGGDIYKYLNMGASGIQMGTRFVTTVECDASDIFKNIYINCEKKDIHIIESPVGMPGRAIQNKFLKDVSTGEKKPFNCPYHCIVTCNYKSSPYCIAKALLNAQQGHFDNGFAFAGENAYRAMEIITVEELFENLKKEYFEKINIE